MKELISNAEFGGERPLYCRHGLRLEDVVIHAGESALKETSDIEAVRCRFEGKYPFWCCDGFVVRDCLFTEGARAALWYSRGLVLENCTFEPDADLAFEYSSVRADIRGTVTSVKNPRTGSILANGYGEIIIDSNIKAPGDCRIVTRDER